MQIISGGRQIVVESSGLMQEVVATALALWQDTAAGPDPGADRDPVGFSLPVMSDPVVQQELSAPEIALPHRLIPQQENPDDRQR